jgi:hypothetical protein
VAGQRGASGQNAASLAVKVYKNASGRVQTPARCMGAQRVLESNNRTLPVLFHAQVGTSDGSFIHKYNETACMESSSLTDD